MNRFYSEVAERAGHRCEYCRAPEVVFNFPFEVEHIIHPRIDEWTAHFQPNADGQIQPLTPTARVTIQQLRLNVPAQLAARRHWSALGVYPG